MRKVTADRNAQHIVESTTVPRPKYEARKYEVVICRVLLSERILDLIVQALAEGCVFTRRSRTKVVMCFPRKDDPASWSCRKKLDEELKKTAVGHCHWWVMHS